MPILIFAQQTQYTLAYALIFAILFLGFLVVCLPRPRSKVYSTPAEEKQAKKKDEMNKVRAKKKKAQAKKNKQRNKARKKAMKN